TDQRQEIAGALGETRTVFAGMSRAEIVVWYGLIVVSTAVFVWGVGRLVAKYRSGRAEPLGPLWPRLVPMARIVFSHSWISRRERLGGLGQLMIFYGFVVLLIGTTILGIQTDITQPVFHYSFWSGGFYLGYKAALDFAGLLFMAGLVLMAVNRWVRRGRRPAPPPPGRAARGEARTN